jgi:hypothetical protein
MSKKTSKEKLSKKEYDFIESQIQYHKDEIRKWNRRKPTVFCSVCNTNVTSPCEDEPLCGVEWDE